MGGCQGPSRGGHSPLANISLPFGGWFVFSAHPQVPTPSFHPWGFPADAGVQLPPEGRVGPEHCVPPTAHQERGAQRWPPGAPGGLEPRTQAAFGEGQCLGWGFPGSPTCAQSPREAVTAESPRPLRPLPGFPSDCRHLKLCAHGRCREGARGAVARGWRPRGHFVFAEPWLPADQALFRAPGTRRRQGRQAYALVREPRSTVGSSVTIRSALCSSCVARCRNYTFSSGER